MAEIDTSKKHRDTVTVE